MSLRERSTSQLLRGRRVMVRLARWPGRLGLFQSVFAVVVAAALVGVGAYWGFSELLLGVGPLAHLTDPSIHPQDVLKLALTVAAGLGGVVALTVAYRRQRAAESGRFGDRFADSAAQLGGMSAAVRMAGAYAMAALADESNETLRRQQCIDVLCSYLRLPYHSGHLVDLLESVVTTDTAVTSDGYTHSDQRTYRPQAQEREVRFTIVGIIRDHLQERAPFSWQGYRFNFVGVTFDGGSFEGAEFTASEVDFGYTDFSSGGVSFQGVKFSEGTVNFVGARFSGGIVNFRETEFSGADVNFFGVEFSDGYVDFSFAEFTAGEVDFALAEFSGGDVNFAYAKFSGGTVSFRDAEFSRGAIDFMSAGFSGGSVSFSSSKFSGGAVDLRRVSDWSHPPAGLPDSEEGLGLPVIWAADWSELPDLVPRLS